ncbi:hypothetical protein FRB96_000824 [Tulasnella sp. 330]|nr:hypothetical protein FRB96_000824 [Tulasnella sp. 330]KAG8881930.1 hypothetical protein FRB97_008888 [Tulasnella sp. 331]
MSAYSLLHHDHRQDGTSSSPSRAPFSSAIIYAANSHPQHPPPLGERYVPLSNDDPDDLDDPPPPRTSLYTGPGVGLRTFLDVPSRNLNQTSRSSSDSNIFGGFKALSSGSDIELGLAPLGATPTVGEQSTHESEKFPVSADPGHWAAETSPDYPEPDDELHNPDPKRDRHVDHVALFSGRGCLNVGCLVLITTALFTLFAGFPIISHYTHIAMGTNGGYNLGGVNSSGQIPSMPGNWALIDLDTPKDAYTMQSVQTGESYQLVFSDEFNVDGRTFYPGDDPYWEAVDLHYWETNNLEWYDPAAITTKDGSLVITLSKQPTHGLDYQGGMMTSWNKFCFTGGIIVVNATLPGANDIWGLWPAVWTLGNLGRAGYGATLDGLWPYSYDSCDVGTLPNQTFPDGTPAANLVGNDATNGGALSYLSGQRLSSCTCDTTGTNAVHPGPRTSNGSYVGRSAPEIDILEAEVDQGTLTGFVSQSAQWAPFNHQYIWDNSSANFEVWQTDAHMNTYVGGVGQQATSVLAETDQACYELSGGCDSVYGFEYKPGADGYITWISQGTKSWTIMQSGLGPDPVSGAGQRLVSQEPMYIIANLGISQNFGAIDFDQLTFPANFMIDWIRVYQPAGSENIGCDPPNFPTADYINTFTEAYNNPNLTTWEQFGQVKPLNRLVDSC